MDQRIIEMLVFNQFDNNPRFTQDSPVYPDVWMEYFNHVSNLDTYRVDLILTPHKQFNASDLLKELLLKLGRDDTKERFEIASNGDTVVVKLTFEELIRVVLPLSKWWKNDLFKNDEPTADLLWLRRLVGAFQLARKENDINLSNFHEFLDEFEALGSKFIGEKIIMLIDKDDPAKLWSASLNRRASLSIELSVPATKADAGRRLFGIDGSGITWAVLDSGIDITHTAFRAIDPKTGNPYPSALGDAQEKLSNFTRIIATYEFTRFRRTIADILTNPSKANILNNLCAQPTSN
ncbi:MAG: hypothetical protein H7246_05805, partial [Phycisphaerae bacterium]|nr:hypothetical protein [Saprospiraceae bacterium]